MHKSLIFIAIYNIAMNIYLKNEKMWGIKLKCICHFGLLVKNPK